MNRLSRTLFLTCSIVILAGAGCNQTTSPIATPPPATNSQIEIEGLEDTAVVSIGPNGFTPATVTIKKGEPVLFVNEDIGGSHWVASNPHPTHADYPSFDAKAPIEPGSSYSFTFEKVGTWGYHDHLSPTKTGTVIVQ